jgi:hypothetical protein
VPARGAAAASQPRAVPVITMTPEEFEVAHSFGGLIAFADFLADSPLSRLGGQASLPFTPPARASRSVKNVKSRSFARVGCNEPGLFPEHYLDGGTPGSLLMAFPGTGNKGVTSTDASLGRQSYRGGAATDGKPPHCGGGAGDGANPPPVGACG